MEYYEMCVMVKLENRYITEIAQQYDKGNLYYKSQCDGYQKVDSTAKLLICVRGSAAFYVQV